MVWLLGGFACWWAAVDMTTQYSAQAVLGGCAAGDRQWQGPEGASLSPSLRARNAINFISCVFVLGLLYLECVGSAPAGICTKGHEELSMLRLTHGGGMKNM